MTTDLSMTNPSGLYESCYDAAPSGVWSAPGRVNLIGEHTDYTGGLVLPFAIDSRAVVAFGPSPDDQFRAVSTTTPQRVRWIAGSELRPGAAGRLGWSGYLFGVAWALREAGHPVPPVQLALASTVPAGSGLSSSAAIECAVALALSDYLGLGLQLPEIARIAQYAENEFVGVPCGLMDQMASAASTAGHALFFNTATGESDHIPFNTQAAGLDLLVIDTRTHHSLADGEYARRRSECETAERHIGFGPLGSIPAQRLDEALDLIHGSRAGVLRRRVRHVVSENSRVRDTVALLRQGELSAAGAALTASHVSLRDDFEVSCAELDLAASTAEEAGALGARMIGGGFGGSVIALVPHDRRSAVEGSVIDTFAAAGYTEPTLTAVKPEAGARRDS